MRGVLALHSDCSYVVGGAHRPLAWKTFCSNSGLWRQFEDLWQVRKHQVRSLKANAHAQSHHIDKGDISMPGLRGNYMADGIAGLAASRRAPRVAVVQQSRHVNSLVRAIAKILVAITGICSQGDEVEPRQVERPPRLPVRRQTHASLALDSRHAWGKRGSLGTVAGAVFKVPDKKFKEVMSREHPCTPQVPTLPRGDAPPSLRLPSSIKGWPSIPPTSSGPSGA